MCGGSVLNEWHILTAAHCVNWPELGTRATAKQVHVLVGVHNYKDGLVNEGWQEIDVAEYIVHVQNITKGTTTPSDIAILRLKEKIKFGNNVGMIEWRDSPSATYEGREATTIGWGWTSENNKVTNTYCHMTYCKLSIQKSGRKHCFCHPSRSQKFQQCRLVPPRTG